jgi:glycosyltransferase involved in cell wall biosynthesis
MRCSVIVSTFNRFDYLAELFNSIVVNQPDEVIVIEAGDVGALHKIYELIRNYDIKFRVYHFPGCSLGESRNKAAELAVGDLIFFSDDDDIWLPNKIETCIKSLGNDSVLVHDYYEFINNSEIKPGKIKYLNIKYLDYLLNFWSNNLGGGSSIVCRRHVVLSVKFNEGLRSCEDIDWLLRLTFANINIVRDNSRLVYYRVHNCRMTSNRVKNIKFELYLVVHWLKLSVTLFLGSLFKIARIILRWIYR